VASYGLQRISGADLAMSNPLRDSESYGPRQVEDHDGNFVDPTDDSVQAAPKVPTGRRCARFYMVLNDQVALFIAQSRGLSFVLVFIASRIDAIPSCGCLPASSLLAYARR